MAGPDERSGTDPAGTPTASDDRSREARARAVVDVTDPEHTVVVGLNLAAEFAAKELGIGIGSTVEPLLAADPETIAESGANFTRLQAGEIDAYDTFATFTDSAGAPVTLRLTLSLTEGPEPDRTYIAIDWREISAPRREDPAIAEEVLEVAQLITNGGLADAPIGVALIDAVRNEYVTVNHAYAGLLGLPRRDFIGKDTAVGRPADSPLAENAGEILAVLRGSIDSVTMTVPVVGESAVVETATLHAIGERNRNRRYLVLYALQRVRTDDIAAELRHPVVTTTMPDTAYSRAVIDPDWRLRFIEPPLVALGVERDLDDRLSVLPSVHPADIPSLLEAADRVRSGRVERSVVRARYRVLTPEVGYLATECAISSEPTLPEGWLILTNRMVSAAAEEFAFDERLREITAGALAEDDGSFQGSRSANEDAARLGDAHGLTPRETQILALLVDGSRVTTIARNLHLSDGTVRNYLSAIFHKVGVRNQAELVEFSRASRASLTRRRTDA